MSSLLPLFFKEGVGGRLLRPTLRIISVHRKKLPLAPSLKKRENKARRTTQPSSFIFHISHFPHRFHWHQPGSAAGRQDACDDGHQQGEAEGGQVDREIERDREVLEAEIGAGVVLRKELELAEDAGEEVAERRGDSAA